MSAMGHSRTEPFQRRGRPMSVVAPIASLALRCSETSLIAMNHHSKRDLPLECSLQVANAIIFTSVTTARAA